MNIRAVVVGAGAIAWTAHLPSLLVAAAADRVRVVGAVDPSPSAARAARLFEDCRAYATVDDLLRADPPDAAFVLTPKETHADLTGRLLDAGIDVFCEKPLATSLGAAEELVELADRRGRLLMVGFNHRFAPVYLYARDALASRPPEVCLAQKYRPAPELRNTLENGIHMLDLMRWYCGEPHSVVAASRFDDPLYEQSVTAQIRFESGTLGVFVSQRRAGQWSERLELVGAGRTVLVDAPDTVRVVTSDGELVRRMTPLAPMGAASVRDKMGFHAEIDHFLDCVQTRREPLTSGADALETQRLVDQVLRAAGLPAE